MMKLKMIFMQECHDYHKNAKLDLLVGEKLIIEQGFLLNYYVGY